MTGKLDTLDTLDDLATELQGDLDYAWQQLRLTALQLEHRMRSLVETCDQHGIVNQLGEDQGLGSSVDSWCAVLNDRILRLARVNEMRSRR